MANVDSVYDALIFDIDLLSATIPRGRASLAFGGAPVEAGRPPIATLPIPNSSATLPPGGHNLTWHDPPNDLVCDG